MLFLKRILGVIVALMVLGQFRIMGYAAPPDITSGSAIMIEAGTGQVIMEKNADERRSPASITKIMTLLITFEQLDAGKISLKDQVLVSHHASSMGGSQVFLAEGEVQSLETLIKCIVVASGNDASVAVAEHIAGSEEAFVDMMNIRALELGMTNTHFCDCCGLSDSDEHYTSAHDVAIMSRELTVKHPEILNYSGIWMEDIIHETPKGNTIFTLSSTNKLLKQYQWATGLKTGSTNKAKYCLSATASKDGVDLIAVILGADSTKERFSLAKAMLSYGFANCRVYKDENREELPNLPVKGGLEEEVALEYEKDFYYLDVKGNDLSGVEKEMVLEESILAPCEEGQVAGKIRYSLNGDLIGEVNILCKTGVEKAGYFDYLRKCLGFYLF